MATIILETFIKAPQGSCFDISRSIDIHISSMHGSEERAIGGKTSGLIGAGETVTWRAKHFFLWFEMTSMISRFEPPWLFRDEMVAGPFGELRHDHFFTPTSQGTLMTDIIHYTLPWRVLSFLPDLLLVRNYLIRLLRTRNEWIKNTAERTTPLIPLP